MRKHSESTVQPSQNGLMDNYIYEYYQKIKDGSIASGKWIKLVYEYLIKGLENRLFFYEPKKANNAIKYIETMCRHHEGKLAPNLIKLELWQKALISSLFGIVDENGDRQFRECFCVVSRKNGKTLLAAAIASYCTFCDGEYGGRIFFVAPKLQQANLCFDAFYQMIQKEPSLAKRTRKRKSDLYVASTNTSAAALAFNYRKSDGLNISACVADEISSWPGQQGLRQYEVLKSSLGARRQPILLSISTSGYVNDGIYDELFNRSTRFLLGDSRERRLLPFLYTIDDIQKWNDINELRKSNPNLGVSVSVNYLLDEIAVAEGSLSKRGEFLTKYANIKQNASTAWLDTQTVEKASGEELRLEDFRHNYCVIGIDLSQTVDLTSVCACIEKNGELYVFSHFFMPAERIQAATASDGVPYEIFRKQGLLTLSGENFVDYHDCYNWIVSLMKDYEILPLVIGYDRYSAQYLIDDLRTAGLNCDDVYQGFNLTPVIRQFEGEIKDGIIHIGNNNLLKAHLLNVALKMDNDTQKVKMVKVGSTARIDGAAALMDAMTVRQKHYALIGQQLKNVR